MPQPSTHPSTHVRRRALLAGAALGSAALLAGCSEEPAASDDMDSAAGRTLLDKGARDSGALLARYDATLTAHPALERRLRPLRDEVARHVGAFTFPEATGSPSATPSATASPSRTPERQRAPKVPGTEKKALAALAEAERHTADLRTAALVSAPPEVARLLASIAAAGAAHAYLLETRDEHDEKDGKNA
ncbi:lipoprotein [Streptomyces olivaceiscleroticus]|uniref:Lipoprotein n=1 Tax=Streptomyces olivaceiscleroticus TaxID=68245 RepID=A0ABP3JQR3_9ACTN